MSDPFAASNGAAEQGPLESQQWPPPYGEPPHPYGEPPPWGTPTAYRPAAAVQPDGRPAIP